MLGLRLGLRLVRFRVRVRPFSRSREVRKWTRPQLSSVIRQLHIATRPTRAASGRLLVGPRAPRYFLRYLPCRTISGTAQHYRMVAVGAEASRC